MGASWLEIESLLKELEEVTAFSHAEALLPTTDPGRLPFRS